LKLEAASVDLKNSPPTPEERIILHNLWLEQLQYEDARGHLIQAPDHIAFPEQTRQQIVKIGHPQERNIHSSIFGGFLMREAFELGYLVATLYLGGRPYTIALDDVAFKKPVPIGSILVLSSQVLLYFL
jgi:acyl-coenzyme A thioesterase 9